MGFCGFGFGMGGRMFMGVLVIGLIIYLILSTRNKNSDETICGKDNSALKILNERYARGEISHEEFEKMIKNIS